MGVRVAGVAPPSSRTMVMGAPGNTAAAQNGVAAAQQMIDEAKALAADTIPSPPRNTGAKLPAGLPTCVLPAQAGTPVRMVQRSRYDAAPPAERAPSATPTGLASHLLPPAKSDLSGLLQELSMSHYLPNLQSQAIFTVKDLRECRLTLQEMKEELGIEKLLHRKRLLQALEGDTETPALSTAAEASSASLSRRSSYFDLSSEDCGDFPLRSEAGGMPSVDASGDHSLGGRFSPAAKSVASSEDGFVVVRPKSVDSSTSEALAPAELTGSAASGPRLVRPNPSGGLGGSLGMPPQGFVPADPSQGLAADAAWRRLVASHPEATLHSEEGILALPTESQQATATAEMERAVRQQGSRGDDDAAVKDVLTSLGQGSESYESFVEGFAGLAGESDPYLLAMRMNPDASGGTEGGGVETEGQAAIRAFLEDLEQGEAEELARKSKAFSAGKRVVCPPCPEPNEGKAEVALDEDGLEEVDASGGMQAGGVVPDIQDAMVHVDNFVDCEDPSGGSEEEGEGWGELEERSSLVDRPTRLVPEECPPGLISAEDDREELPFEIEMIPKEPQGNDYSREESLRCVHRDVVEGTPERHTAGEDGATVTSPVEAFNIDEDFDYDTAPLDRKF